MGVGNTEQGTKVISYILDFLKSLKNGILFYTFTNYIICFILYFY